ncbi:MAG: EFR1 family ferrodoxin [Bacillota bacterium]|nr:EFR1 family ferrodoxin [Bacillota bacterium]
MILYFSGTGNSRYTAVLLGKALDDEVVSLNELISRESIGDFSSEKPYVFVLPTYCYHIPSVVEEFINEASFSGCCKAYFVMTCGAGTGGAGAVNKAICKEKKLNYMGTYTLVMPDNYLVMYAPSSREEAERILASLPEKISEIAGLIESGKTFNQKGSAVSKEVSIISSKLFNKFFVKPEKFSVTEDCVSCGVCVNNCPLHNVVLTEGVPEWGSNCVHCLSCICSCPKNAIEYGKGTKGRRRHYVFSDGKLK